jgi:beta-fructofuranosidase
MAFELVDRWVWDSWTAEHRGEYHLYYLQAPRSLDNPDLRHRHASVGHAVSTDLTGWREVGDALRPGNPGEWDDRAVWTGCVVAGPDRWWMFYTGAAHRDDGLVQRIGAATSRDLTTWSKHPHNPLVEVDPRWYETLDTALWHDQAWRDPWVYPVEGGYEMLITARANHGPARARGVIGRAFSPNLASWTVRSPLTSPSGFGHLEVPQLETVDGRRVLLFSCSFWALSSERKAAGVPTSGCYLAPVTENQPLDVSMARPLETPNLYSARLVRSPSGEWVVLGFERHDEHGRFAGRIADPIPLREAAPWLVDGFEPALAAPLLPG